MTRAILVGVLAGCAGLAAAASARAAVVSADPSNYTQKLATLQPGDTLELAAGDYTSGLTFHNASGQAGKPITVEGPASGSPARFLGRSCCNTVSFTDAAYITIKNLVLDGQNLAGVFAVAAQGNEHSDWTHDITIEGCTVVNSDGGGTSQQTDGISTKVPSWNWVIRGNTIDGAGTGMYLGNSDGYAAFVGGLIEGNLYLHTLGYNMEIKQQISREANLIQGMPTGTEVTIIRDNVFLKENNPSPDGTRPNLLVDGFPDSGPGSQDHYDIYGNFFYHNDDDALLQATGRVHVYDNVFVDSKQWAVHFMNHGGKTVIDALVYDNTIYNTTHGISFAVAPSGVSLVEGNAIFAATPLSGTMTNSTANVTDTVANAGNYVVNPSLTLGQMNFYPKSGSALKGAAYDLSSVKADTDYDKDFNATQRDFTYRGAYHGEGTNPGWQLAAALKSMGSGGASGSGGSAGTSGSGGSGGSAGTSAGGSVAAGGAGTGGSAAGSGAAGAGTSPSANSGSSGGCGCSVAGAPQPSWLALLGLFGIGCVRRRRRRARQRARSS